MDAVGLRSGGLELLVGGAKSVSLEMAPKSTLKDLICHVRDRIIQERKELFAVDDTVCVAAPAVAGRPRGAEPILPVAHAGGQACSY